MRILEAGRIAPSAVNYQPWYFVVVKDPDNLQRLYECYPREWFKTAPCVIVLCGDHRQSWKRKDGKDHCDIDVAIAADHMTLQATSEGLATCWVCNFNRPLLSSILHLPDEVEPVVMLPVGYPSDKTDPNRHREKRKKTEEIVFFEKLNLKS